MVLIPFFLSLLRQHFGFLSESQDFASLRFGFSQTIHAIPLRETLSSIRPLVFCATGCRSLPGGILIMVPTVIRYLARLALGATRLQTLSVLRRGLSYRSVSNRT